MKKYKASKYNLSVYCDHDSFSKVIANAYSGTIMYADDELAELLQNFNSDKFIKLWHSNRRLHKYLRENHFVVEEALNEVDRVKIQFDSVKYDHKHMHLTIVPTEACNLACIYCYENGCKERSMPKKVQEQIKNFIEQQKDIIKSLAITWYGGEPLLKMDVIDELSKYFLKFTKENNIQYSASMITNGTLLDEQTVDKLVNYKIDSIQVTLDGLEEQHNKRRFYRVGDKNSFQNILEGIKKCVGKISVGIRINVDKTNVDQYKKLIDLLYNEKLLGSDSGNSASLGLVKAWTDKVAVSKKEMLSLDEFIHWSDNLKCYVQQQNGENSRQVKFSPSLPCGALCVNNFLISPNGDLKKCWIYAAGSEGIVGNLRTGLDLTKAYTTKWTAYSPCLDVKCEACKLLPICAGGCPYENLNFPEDKAEHCSYMFKLIKNNLILSAELKKQIGGQNEA